MNLKRLKIVKVTMVAALQFSCFWGISQTQVEDNNTSNSTLFEEITKLDSIFFSAYNTGNTKTYESFISKDIEFFHDKNGFIDSKPRIIKSFEKMVGAERTTSYSITRKLVENSQEVYEIPEFGALQKGTHQFVEINDDQKKITQAKFIHLWKKENGNWLITKVISYDHQPIKDKLNPDEKFITLTKEQLDAYVGKYQFSPEFILTIVREQNKLYGLAQGDKIEIKPYDEHKFLIATDNSKIEFKLNENNTIKGMEMESKNGIMKAQKIAE